MSDWGHDSEDLFRSARKALSPSTSDRERMRARLAMKLGAAAFGAAASIATTTTAATAGTAGAGAATTAGSAGVVAKAGGLSLLAKVLAPIVVLGAVGTATVAPRVLEMRARSAAVTAPALTTSPAATPATATPATAPITTAPATDDAPPALSVSVADLPAAKPVAPAHHGALGAPKPTVVTEAARDEEAALVAAIDAALRAGDVAGASRLADDHQRRFPAGLLVEEREGARVIARCTTSASAGAADAFLRAHPRSPMRSRILAACGTNTDER